MKFPSPNLHKAEIVFYNGAFGFVRLSDESTAFFPSSSLPKGLRTSLQLLDQVHCQTEVIEVGPHAGKLLAKSVQFIKRGDFTNYLRLIGQFSPRSKRHGSIYSPRLPQEVVVFHTRVLPRDSVPAPGGMYVFHPVKSSKNANELFAFFAYPLEQEQDVPFLREQFASSQFPQIQAHLDTLLGTPPGIDPIQRLLQGLQHLGFVGTSEEYQRLLPLIAQYTAESRNIPPPVALLQSYVGPKYLLLLWENRLVSDYDPATMDVYFHGAGAPQKRSLLRRLDKPSQLRVLTYHVDQVLNRGGAITRVNNELKTLLDLVHRDPETQQEELYHRIYSALNLLPTELYDLWAKGYVHRLADEDFEQHIDFHNHLRVRQALDRKDDRLNSQISNYYESRLLSFLEIGQTEEDSLFGLALFARLFNLLFPQRFNEVWPKLLQGYSLQQRFVLWLFELPVVLDGQAYYAQHQVHLSAYLRLRYYLRQADVHPAAPSPTAAEVSLDGLALFIGTHTWNALLSPTPIYPEDEGYTFYHFLPEVAQFNVRFGFSLDVKALAKLIYSSLPLYQPTHVRLWLQGYLEDSFLDFVGFREPFKSLTQQEKQQFRSLANERIKDDQNAFLQQNYVSPCTEFEEEVDGRTYWAHLENIFFSLGHIQLRLETGDYTPRFTNAVIKEKAGTGLNRIPVGNDLNTVGLQVKVSENGGINHIDGLEQVFDLIQEANIEKALADILGGVTSGAGSNAYAEDWELRDQILRYLAAQCFSSQIVSEPVNYYRRLDEESGVDAYEKTCLYALKVGDDRAVVWENVDLSEDRSTYIFKSEEAHLPALVDRLSTAIRTQAQFRSALSSRQLSPEHVIFRSYFGFIGSIRKKRGRNHPFADWEKRLGQKLLAPIPPLPTAAEWESVEHVTFTQSRHRPPLPIRITPIDVATLDTMDVDTSERTKTVPLVATHTGEGGLADKDVWKVSAEVVARADGLLKQIQQLNLTFLSEYAG